MKNLIYLILFFSIQAKSQVLPKEGSKLNYRMAGFSIPGVPEATKYQFEIASGKQLNEKDFTASRIKAEYSENNRIIIELPHFGQWYSWRVRSYNAKGKIIEETPYYQFATDSIVYVDTANCRLRIIDEATAFKDLLVLMDSRVMYNMKGEPLWFLPNIPGKVSATDIARDLKPTYTGSFTFLIDNDAYEVDYHGNLLWEAPRDLDSVGRKEDYHHEFTKLRNGHYMIAGQERLSLPDSNGTSYSLVLGTLVEFDKDGKLVWQWKAADYFFHTDKYKASDGRMYANTHLNAFHFDMEQQVIYLSFRDINSVIKIAYPSGEVIADYRQGTDDLFEAQHHAHLAANGDLLLFDNNAVKGRDPLDDASRILRLKETGRKRKPLKLKWAYSCNLDSQTTAYTMSGGSLYELEDGSILACMGAAGRVFIVSPQKELLWNAIPEKRLQDQWVVMNEYRASFIKNKKALIPFIFK